MGKGKGSFDHWASRIAVSKVIFELKGDIHEQVARDAFRLAGNKMPGKFILYLQTFVEQTSNKSLGMYEFVKKGDPPVVGITKLDGITMEELKRPRRAIPLGSKPPPAEGSETTPTVSTPASPTV
jgi:hypothetical protein